MLIDKNIIIYFIGGRDFQFLEGYESLSIDKSGNQCFINKDSYIHRIDNLVGQVTLSKVDYSGKDKKDVFSNETYLQYLVYSKIKRDLASDVK